MKMSDVNSMVHNMEELLAICSRSIVAPGRITAEADRILAIMNDSDLDQKFIVEGCETLSLIASGFIRSGYQSFIMNYALKTGINHLISGFASKDELISFCEFCVEFGDENLSRIRYAILAQLEIENRMTQEEILILNHNNAELSVTVQEQIIDYIKLSLLVNSMKEFFKKYYKGLN